MTLKPLSIIYNARSGFHASNKEQVYEQLLTYFTEQGFEIQVFELGEKKDFPTLMQSIIQRHQSSENIGVIVAAGGDGTLNAVAKALLGSNIPLGILPLGTFNYVARVLNIPIDIMQAAEVIATGQIRSIHVAKINDQIYLN
jgi:diacylglycerol kinase family enzyme